MASSGITAGFGLVMLLFVVIALLVVCFNPTPGGWLNGDYIDEHQGRGSIDDDWGLDALE